jgi:hypothetical protein
VDEELQPASLLLVLPDESRDLSAQRFKFVLGRGRDRTRGAMDSRHERRL